jgi:hypothetical protein
MTAPSQEKDMWDVYQVEEGECKGKFVVLSFMGHPTLDDEGEPEFFDTPEEAIARIVKVRDGLTELVKELEGRHG